MSKKSQKRWALSPLTLLNILVFMFLLGAVVSPFTSYCTPDDAFVAAKGENPLMKSEAVNAATQVQKALREIYKEVNPAVVRIETEQTVKLSGHPFMNDPFFRRFFNVPKQEQRQKRQGLGSGFIISKDGYIVTNHHVVKSVDKITVKLVNGQEHAAKLVGSDPTSDIALLKIEDAKNLKVVHVGDSDRIEVGDMAIAIGNPFGLSSTFTMGVVSSKGQDIHAADGVPRIQTDAAINPGNSGGPLLNLRGEVIGINQMIYTQSGGSVGIGFAIPINYAMEVLEQLKKGKEFKPGYIGVSVAPSPTEDQMKELNLQGKEGLLIAQVELGSPAWKAGVRPYDFITKVDDKPADKFSVLKSTVVRKGVGDEIKLTVIRDGKSRVFEVTIGKSPDTE